MSHVLRLPSAVSTNAPLRVPTSTRTLLISLAPSGHTRRASRVLSIGRARNRHTGAGDLHAKLTYRFEPRDFTRPAHAMAPMVAGRAPCDLPLPAGVRPLLVVFRRRRDADLPDRPALLRHRGLAVLRAGRRLDHERDPRGASGAAGRPAD